MKKDFDVSAGPHAPTEKILHDLGVAFTRNNHGFYVTNGDIELSGNKMTRLPDLSRVRVTGHFMCDDCGLESMEGSPASVSRSIWCRKNRLKNLIGITQDIWCDVYACMNEDMTSLKGTPPHITTLWCEDNKNLVNLFGVPKIFTDLRTPFGNFTSYAQIPSDLLRDLESERLRAEARAKCGAAQEAITLDAPPIIAAARKIRL